MSTTSANRTGRQILLNFSMPDFTPRATMATVTARKARWKPRGAQVREMKRSNEPLMASGAVWMKSSRTAWTRYSSDQPPTTL